jgi:hypothetical protein
MNSKRIAKRLEKMGYKLTRRLNYWVVSCEELPWDWSFDNLKELDRWVYMEEHWGDWRFDSLTETTKFV